MPRHQKENESRPQSPEDETEKDQEVLALGTREVTQSKEEDLPDDESDRSRTRLSKRINDEAIEEDLVEWLRENPVLWDSAHRDFRLAKKKESMWTEKAKELDRSGDFVKGWYKDLRDQFVKLRKDKSGDGARRFTYREKWVLERFEFLAHTVKYRKKNPCAIRSVAATKAMESGDLDQAEHIAAMDRECINSVDDPVAGPSCEATAKKRKRAESPSLMEVTRQLSTAQTQVLQLQQQLMEPTDKRASYLEYFKSVVKDITEEEWEDYHKLSVELEFKWQRNARQRRQQSQYLQQQSTAFQQPARNESAPPTSSEMYQPRPWQWQYSYTSPWKNQNQDYMAAYSQQPLSNNAQQQPWTHTASRGPRSAVLSTPSKRTQLTSTPIPAKGQSSQGTTSTAKAVSRAMFVLDDQADINLSSGSLPTPLSESTIIRVLGNDTSPTPLENPED